MLFDTDLLIGYLRGNEKAAGVMEESEDRQISMANISNRSQK